MFDANNIVMRVKSAPNACRLTQKITLTPSSHQIHSITEMSCTIVKEHSQEYFQLKSEGKKRIFSPGRKISFLMKKTRVYCFSASSFEEQTREFCQSLECKDILGKLACKN